MENFSALQNVTNLPDLPNWNFAAVSQLIVSIITILLNLPLLVLFACQQKLISPFKIYIMNLLWVNLIMTMLNSPMDILNSLFTRWIAAPGWCSLYLYTVYVLFGIQTHSHLLITINRLWAVTSPVTYRHYHTMKVAALTCCAMWVYIHVMCLPLFIPDELYYRLPLSTHPCVLNVDGQRSWAIANELLIYDGPIVFMLVAFVYLCYKRRQKLKARSKVLPRGAHSEFPIPVTTSTQDGEDDGEATPSRPETKQSTESNKAFILLACLTASVTICWTAAVSYFTALLFTRPYLPPPMWEHVGFILFSLQQVLDPLLFVLTFADIREAIRGCFCRVFRA